MEATKLQKKWILYGAIAGILATIVYLFIYFSEIGARADLLVGLIFGFSIGITAAGIYNFVKINNNCMCLQAGTLIGIFAAFTYILNTTVFESLNTPLEGILVQGDQSFVYSLTNRIQLGLSLSWEILFAASMFAFSVAFFKQPRPGKIISILGILLALLLIFTNIYYFPEVEDGKQLFGLGPMLPAWHLLASIFILSSLRWIKVKPASQ